MPIIPCIQKIDCPGTDFPIRNLSSEEPDRFRFLGYSWGYDDFLPRADSDWEANGCPPQVFFSEVSQEQADLAAARSWADCRSRECTANCANDGGTGTDVAYNQAQTVAVSCPDGTPFYYTVPAGTFAASSVPLANQMAISYANFAVYTVRVCLSTLSANACAGQAFNTFITGVTRNPPLTFAVVSGALPPGMTLTTAGVRTARISGTCSTPGNYTFTIRATDIYGDFMTKTYTLAVIGLTNAIPLPNPQVGTAYAELLAATGGIGPYTYAVSSGTLPDGLALDASGQFSGTPTTVETQDITVLCTDSGGKYCNIPLTLEVEEGCPDNIAEWNVGLWVIDWVFPFHSDNLLWPRAVYAPDINRLRVFDRETGAQIVIITNSENQAMEGGAVYVPSTDRIWFSSTNGYGANDPMIQQINPDTIAAVSEHFSGGLNRFVRHMNYHTSNNVVVAEESDTDFGTVWLISINPITMARTNRVDFSLTGINAIAYSSGSNRIYVGAGVNVRVYNAAYALVDTVVLPQACVRLVYVATTDKVYALYTVAGLGRLAVIDCATNTIDTTILLGTLSNFLGTNSDTWVAHVAGTSIEFVSTSTNTISCTRILPGVGSLPVWDDLGRVHIGESSTWNKILRLE